MADLQLLGDQELMALWEQTQIAAAVIQAHGGVPRSARRYEHAVVMELQRRLANSQFGKQSNDWPEGVKPGFAAPHFMVIRA